MRVQIKRILCTTDFSDFSNQTIPLGSALAKEFDATLLICHVVELPFAAMYGEVQLDPIAQQARMTTAAHEMLARIVEDRAVQWTPHVVIGHPADEIVRLAAEEQVDLVVSATHGRSGIKRLILGSVTERLMRTLSCPLLIVRERPQAFAGAAGGGFHPQTILVGCDFSSDSDLAFQYGLSLAQEFESELHLVHVIEPPVYQNVLSMEDADGPVQREDIAPRLQRKLAGMVPMDARHWCSPVTVLLEGKADEELSRYAMSNAVDLIVLGVHGHGLVEKLFVGSTTDRVARQSKCPVLAVKPVA